jgi:hypothetical protein
MNKNMFLITLSESERTDFGRIEFARQSEEQKVFSAIWGLESQVNNGGFEQYFCNPGGEVANFAPIALARIGAHKCAAIVSDALRTVSIDPLPTDHAMRNALMRSLGSAASEELAVLNTEFFSYPEDLTDLLFEFVRVHPSIFGPIE